MRHKILKKCHKIFVSIMEWYETHAHPRLRKWQTHFMVWVHSFNRNDPEVEFYPAALEVLETPPSPVGRATAVVIMWFFVFTLLWSIIGSVDIIATAQGKIVPTGRTKIIQPLEAGVVHAIHVQDGEKVKAGQVLIEIDSTINEAERNRLHDEDIDAELDVARLKAVLHYADDPLVEFTPPPDASPAKIATAKSLLDNQVSEIRAKLEGLDRQIAQSEGNRTAVASTIDKLTQSIPMLAERAKMHQSLSKRGYGSKLDTLTAQQDLVEHTQELEVQKGRLAEATAGVASLQQQRKGAEAEFQHTNLDKLAEATQKATSLHAQWVEAAQKFRLQTLTAPVDGTVQQLSVHTNGGVVTPAQALLAIVPADSHIEIEAMVSNRDIGFVHPGQDVAIKVDTFNFTRYGLLHGHVTSVSQDAITHDNSQSSSHEKTQVGVESDSSELAGQELVYTARIALEESKMDVDGQLVNLTPGMAVTAEIKTGTRHIIGYLLSPLRRHIQQSLREQ